MIFTDREKDSLAALADSGRPIGEKKKKFVTTDLATLEVKLMALTYEFREFIEQIARTHTESETVGGFSWEGATADLNQLIRNARSLMGIDPRYEQVYCVRCCGDGTDCDCYDDDDEEEILEAVDSQYNGEAAQALKAKAEQHDVSMAQLYLIDRNPAEPAAPARLVDYTKESCTWEFLDGSRAEVQN
jgi:hypothetical protein